MFRSGYVAIVGAPNVGKSTLLNALIGEKVSIVTPKPQTTRHRILGILHRPQAQILLLDTPGIHASTRTLNRAMVEVAWSALQDADVTLHLLPSFADEISDLDRKLALRVRAFRKRYLVAINKIDCVAKERLLPWMQKIHDELAPEAIMPISALRGEGLKELLVQIEACLPEGPRYYPEDLYTDQEMRFLAAEIVREKAMHFLRQELPYALATQAEAFQNKPKMIHIYVAVVVEKASQKSMVIGDRGTMIKKIGQAARRDLEKMLGKKVYLELFVKVLPHWMRSEARLRELGIRQ